MKNKASAFFKMLFEQGKLGSFFLFVDNVSIPTHNWLDDLVKEHNLYRKQGYIKLINTSDCTPSGDYNPLERYTFEIEKSARKEFLEFLKPHYGRYFDQAGKIAYPKLQSKVVFRIWRKV